MCIKNNKTKTHTHTLNDTCIKIKQTNNPGTIEIFLNDNNGTWPDGLCNRPSLKVVRPCNVESQLCRDICG